MLIELLRNDGILKLINENDFDRYITEFLDCKLNSSYFIICDFNESGENIINTVPCSFIFNAKAKASIVYLKISFNDNIRTAFIIWCKKWKMFDDFTFCTEYVTLTIGVGYENI